MERSDEREKLIALGEEDWAQSFRSDGRHTCTLAALLARLTRELIKQ